MKYIKFTYVDLVTGVSVAKAEAMNGTRFPAVTGLKFVWAQESNYPTAVPMFFGTCPDDSDTNVNGVLAELDEADYVNFLADEMRARDKTPKKISMAQARSALISAGYMPAINKAFESMPGVAGEVARSDWEYATVVERNAPLTLALAAVLGLTDEQLDALFVSAAAPQIAKD
jgi:hypothetical protein